MKKLLIELLDTETGTSLELTRAENSHTGMTSGYDLTEYRWEKNRVIPFTRSFYDTNAAFNALERWEKKHPKHDQIFSIYR